MKGLAVPEDEATPHTPLDILGECDVQAFDADLTTGTYPLSLCQLRGALGEEQLVAAFRGASAVFL